MSGNCERSVQQQLSNSLESLHRVVQLLSGSHVISDRDSFTSSLNDVQNSTAQLAGLISASSPENKVEATLLSEHSATPASKAIDLTEDGPVDDNTDEFDSLLCGMDDEQFELATSQPVEQYDDDVGEGERCGVVYHVLSVLIDTPPQEHIDKLKQVFGHSQFKK